MLYDMYVNEHKSTKQIAEHLGVDDTSVSSKIRKFGIKLRGKGGANNTGSKIEQKLIGSGITSIEEARAKGDNWLRFHHGLTLWQVIQYFRRSRYRRMRAHGTLPNFE